ncbi:hypothetical protein Aduo_002940 [Ancylostoma duodenale]
MQPKTPPAQPPPPPGIFTIQTGSRPQQIQMVTIQIAPGPNLAPQAIITQPGASAEQHLEPQAITTQPGASAEQLQSGTFQQQSRCFSVWMM